MMRSKTEKRRRHAFSPREACFLFVPLAFLAQLSWSISIASNLSPPSNAHPPPAEKPLANGASPGNSGANWTTLRAGRGAATAIGHDQGNQTPAEDEIQILDRWLAEVRNDTASDRATLLPWIKQNKNITSGSATGLDRLLSSPFYFAPGTLPLSRASSLRQCYVDPAVYGSHFMYGKRRLSFSEEHQLAYVFLPKSGSSTARFVMETEFGAAEKMMNPSPPVSVISFVRDPLSRFYSQYDEAFLRTAPWNKSKNPYYIDPATEKAGRPHPFPFLYEGLRSHGDYAEVYCPGRARRRVGGCRLAETVENGTLASRFERFVREWDGRSPHDVHLRLQAPLLSTMYVAELYNVADSAREWDAIAKKYRGRGIDRSGEVKRWSHPRRFDTALVGRAARRRVCELALLDYCCLNFPLPDDCCGGDGTDGDDELLCKMDYDKKSDRLRIQPSRFPERKRN